MQHDRAFALAKEHYAEWGVDVDAALARLSARSRSRCTAGRGTTSAGSRAPARRSAAAWRSPATTPARPGRPTSCGADLDKALSLIPGTHRLNLHASYAETGGRTVERDALAARALPRLDRLGEVAADRDGLQPDVLRPPAGRRRLHPRPPRRRRSAGSGSITASPAGGSARPSARRWARPASPTSGFPTAPRTRPSTARARASGWPSRSTRSSPSRSTRGSTATPSRASSSASARRPTSSARTSSTSATPSRARSCSASTPATSIRPRSISDKISAVLDLARRDPAARQPGRALGQRPRRDPHRRAAGDRAGDRPRRLPRPRPHRPRLLRRQHQPRGRLGDRHARHAQGAAAGPARADRPAPRASRPRATTPPGWRCWRSSRRFPSARSGTTIARPRASRSAATGWRRSRTYERDVPVACAG